MKTPLIVRNGFCRIPQTAPARLVRALDTETAFLVAGHEMSPAFRKKYWDGREHLLKFSKKLNCYLLPTGLLGDLLKMPMAEDFEVIDERRKPGPSLPMAWTGFEPRDHQLAATEAALMDRGILTGRGLLNLPIRSGKTLTAAWVIHKTGLKTVFVVPSDLLLEQTVEAFKQFLNPAPVGKCGGGTWDPRWITVATFQTLIADLARAQPLLASCDILFVDEAHHLDAPAWRGPLLSCDAPYKLGLSATIFSNRDVPNDKGSIWLKAVCGPIVHRVSMKQMFDLGLLVPPEIIIYPITEPGPDAFSKYSWKAIYQKLIVENYQRNHGIADLVKQGVDRGMRVLVDTGRIDQLKTVVDYVKGRGVAVAALHGKTPKSQRLAALERFKSGELMCIVGTILGEGIDIPELEMVINAEGLVSKKQGIQRMRNLTPSGEAKRAIFIDFADMTNDKLRAHSLERLRTYKSFRGFKLRAGKVDGNRFILPT